jgi:hypothetical protein
MQSLHLFDAMASAMKTPFLHPTDQICAFGLNIGACVNDLSHDVAIMSMDFLVEDVCNIRS